jgi:D-serine deaminase-like pyridoxal phosphate-dependent protein
MPTINDLPTPTVLADRGRVAANIRSMQDACAAHGVELRPHIKTHKMVAVGRMQLAAGARGFTCAKLGEAEALLPSGVRRIFVAHSLVDLRQARRIAALAERLDEFFAAATSGPQADALAGLARLAGRRLPVMMAVDTGLGREGVRSQKEAESLAAQIARSAHLELRGFYTHEGQLYAVPREEQSSRSDRVVAELSAVRDAIDPGLPIWPGCSVSARRMAGSGRVEAVRPGAYVFGDLSLTELCGVVAPADAAVHVLATVVDLPEPGLALIDAGSKTLSGDRTPAGVHAAGADGRDLAVVRVNEEHGFVRGSAVGSLRIGDRLRLVPAHVCPVINLTDEVVVVEGDNVVDRWAVEARGQVR